MDERGYVEWLRRTAYELYKLDWMTRVDHRMLIDGVHEFADEIISDKDIYAFDGTDDPQTIEDMFCERGFGNGSMYVCFEEFLDSEYQDKEYMKELLTEAHFNECQKYDELFA